MKILGIFLIIIGIICGYTALNMDTSVETSFGHRVNNLGLMNQQTNFLIGAGITFISGIILIGFSSKPKITIKDDTRICPYCAEEVKISDGSPIFIKYLVYTFWTFVILYIISKIIN